MGDVTVFGEEATVIRVVAIGSPRPQEMFGPRTREQETATTGVLYKSCDDTLVYSDRIHLDLRILCEKEKCPGHFGCSSDKRPGVTFRECP